MNYVFMTDSDSDLPYDLKVKYDIPVVNMPYALNGKEYFDDLGQTINSSDYFNAMRNGAAPITSALNETVSATPSGVSCVYVVFPSAATSQNPEIVQSTIRPPSTRTAESRWFMFVLNLFCALRSVQCSTSPPVW